MRTVLTLLFALAIAGPSVALQLPLAGPPAANEHFADALRGCASGCVDLAARETDAIVDMLGALPRDVDATAAAAIELAGLASAPLPATRSTSLEAAILRLYDANGIAVDAMLAAEVARQGRDAPVALTELVDAVADAQLASARILPAEDVAALRHDLRTQMLLMTLRGDAALPERLARADLPLVAAAALRVTGAMAALPELAPVEGCGRAIDLPFIQVGAPCDDVYAAETLNFLQIDYGGNDVYLNNAGSGIAGVGVGISIDQGAGNDVYRATGSSQGFGLAGVGILVDEGGSDLYNLTQFGQGFGVAGLGMLYDQGEGGDVYESPHVGDTIGTKGGGLGGIGVLRDDGGSDSYQQDGLDGFVYGAAGGLGLLADHGQGADRYISRDVNIVLLGTPLGEFVGPIMVSAEVSATAILYEEGGDDLYSCGDHVRQGCQGAGGVGGVALHLELDGNDVYRLGESVTPLQADLLPVFPSGQGIAYGEGSAPPGPGVGILRDLAGDDTYIASAYAQGYATGGLGFLLDEGGSDSYSASLAAPLLGARVDGGTWADGLALGLGIDRN